ncbi:AAA family ATPase [Bacillus sp. FSL K6-3431]|uniref:AAA family ATPase n=1 Tax=Bacillus sp. FSL K6-3431 TaxID=2921500 RepID=UPI0030F4B663
MKIHIIGGSGTGKSTLAKFISEKEHIKWIDTDNYLWKDDFFTENNPLEKRKELYQNDMESCSSYVASGSIFSWCPEGFSNRDHLVFLFLDEFIRMDRLRNREIERIGISEMWMDENGKYTNEFLDWCKTYLTEEDENMAGTYAEQVYQMALSKSPVLKLDSSRTVEELYAEILSRLNQY